MRTLLSASCALVLGAFLHAQVPTGWAACSTFRPGGAAGAVEGGIVVFNPYNPTQRFAVTGLPPNLTGATSGGEDGAAHLLIRKSDGALIVSEFAPAGQPIFIHVITLNGQAVATDVPIQIATSTGTGRIGGIDWLDASETQVVFCYDNINSSTLGSKGVGILDLASQTATPIPFAFVPAGTLTTCLVDRANQKVFFTVYGLGSAPISSRVMDIPLTGGVPGFGPTIVGTAQHLGFDRNGDVLLGLINGSASDIYRINPVTRVARIFSTGLNDVRSFAIDEVSGGYIGYGDVGGTVGYYNFNEGGSQTLLFTPAATGPESGAPGAMVRFPLMEVYGTNQPNQANTYQWLVDPAAGGAPLIGNASFALHMRGTPSAAIGVMALSLGAATGLPSPFGNLWVDPAQFLGALTLNPTPVQIANVPLPNDPNLVGLDVFAQAIHLEGNRLRTTKALRFTITN